LRDGVTIAPDFDDNTRSSGITHTSHPDGEDPVELFSVRHGYDAAGNLTFPRNLLAGNFDH